MGPAAGRVRNVLDDLVWTPVLIVYQLVLFSKLECQVNFWRTQDSISNASDFMPPTTVNHMTVNHMTVNRLALFSVDRV